MKRTPTNLLYFTFILLQVLHDVFARGTVISKLTYCAPSWSLVLVPPPTVPSWNHLTTDAGDLATAVTTSCHTVKLSVMLTTVFSQAHQHHGDVLQLLYQTVFLSHTVCVKEHRIRHWSLNLLTLMMLECCTKTCIEHFINIYFLLNHLCELRVTTLL